MNLKKVIEYIAEEDLEINLTLQVGSETNESLKEEVRQLRKRIDELQMNGDAFLPKESTETPDHPEEDLDLQENYDRSEEAEMSDEPEEKVEEVGEDFEVDDEEEVDEELAAEAYEEEGADPETADGEFEEMFGEEGSSTGEPREESYGGDEEEPTEEERTEAEADFEQLFGDAV